MDCPLLMLMSKRARDVQPQSDPTDPSYSLPPLWNQRSKHPSPSDVHQPSRNQASPCLTPQGTHSMVSTCLMQAKGNKSCTKHNTQGHMSTKTWLMEEKKEENKVMYWSSTYGVGRDQQQMDPQLFFIRHQNETSSQLFHINIVKFLFPQR